MENDFTQESEKTKDEKKEYSTGYKILRYLGFLVLIIIGTIVAASLLAPYIMG